MKKSGELHPRCYSECCTCRRAAARRGWKNRRRDQEKLSRVLRLIEERDDEIGALRMHFAQREVEKNQRDFSRVADIAALTRAPAGWGGLSSAILGIAAPVCARFDVLNPFHN